MSSTEKPRSVPVEQVVREEVFDVRGVRIRARELVIDHGTYSRCLLELRLVDADASVEDGCVVDLRRAGDAASLLPVAVDAFAATVASRREARRATATRK
jgi:hypothetical protein